MANTLGGINLAQIAQESLKALTLEFLPLKAFTTDFNMDIKDRGESVSTRVPSTVAAQDIASGGYAPTDVTSTAKTITLNQFKGHVCGFTDAEVSKAGDLNWLKRVFIEPGLAAVREAVFDTILALVTNANFGAAGFTGAATTFDADDLADLAQVLSTANVPRASRFALIKPTYFANLAKDNAIQASYAYGGSEVVRDGRIPRVHGFDIYEYNDVPANGENLVGLVGAPSGLIMAARQPATPQHFTGDVENVADPVTGLPIQFRNWYDPDNGISKLSMTVLYGAAVGVAGNVSRMVSA